MTDKPSLPLLDDVCLPFQIEGQDIKGRVVRLGRSVDEILSKHNYPDAVSKMMGETLAFTALIGSLMKYDGILTTQMKGEGPFQVLVSDFFKDANNHNVGDIRGYASFQDGVTEGDSLGEMFGDNGYMAITIDQGKFMERYQGIVKLEGEHITHAAEEYFRSSEQLPTKVMLTCEKDSNGKWQAAAIMIQHYARNTQDEMGRDEVETKDQWNTASIMLSSLKTQELLDQNLSLQNLLIRLYHESGVRIFDHTHIKAGCRCSEEKIRTTLASLDLEELNDVATDGMITVTCDFCTTDHKYELAKLLN
ncbi:MAG: Hsp33 family molecular chaperone HslO [Emcibacteraceae bacterium]|nr:Hsp33 family molecular chaperone HslO [Emcibacteraceae bacterium]MDG1995110.1 Hsp33 family molecular chaperone HslO [Emcibacteraceae bacterium]